MHGIHPTIGSPISKWQKVEDLHSVRFTVWIGENFSMFWFSWLAKTIDMPFGSSLSEIFSNIWRSTHWGSEQREEKWCAISCKRKLTRAKLAHDEHHEHLRSKAPNYNCSLWRLWRKIAQMILKNNKFKEFPFRPYHLWQENWASRIKPQNWNWTSINTWNIKHTAANSKYLFINSIVSKISNFGVKIVLNMEMRVFFVKLIEVVLWNVNK